VRSRARTCLYKQYASCCQSRTHAPHPVYLLVLYASYNQSISHPCGPCNLTISVPNQSSHGSDCCGSVRASWLNRLSTAHSTPLQPLHPRGAESICSRSLWVLWFPAGIQYRCRATVAQTRLIAQMCIAVRLECVRCLSRFDACASLSAYASYASP
jgi:hypothetical protein